MTPAARVQAAIECLDAVLSGERAESVLTRWARGARYAGSKDRAAVRDHVYDVLRRKRAATAMGVAPGGAVTGRALMLGMLRLNGEAPEGVFTGQGHGPAVLTDAELTGLMGLADLPDLAEMPDWVATAFRSQLGPDFGNVASALATRAPVFLRHNPRKATMAEAVARLQSDGVETRIMDAVPGALKVVDGARRLRGSQAYRQGMVELQDLSSQAAMALVPLTQGDRVLDYCAGGGGKVLALAGRQDGAFHAHDINAARMRDLPERAERAGVRVRVLSGGMDGAAHRGSFDVVLCDVPCSGSGTWRRDPDAKWRFDPDDLTHLTATQHGILTTAAALVAPGGHLVYTTCSMLDQENGDRIAGFVAENPDWRVARQESWLCQADGGDGFFLTILTRTV